MELTPLRHALAGDVPHARVFLQPAGSQHAWLLEPLHLSGRLADLSG